MGGEFTYQPKWDPNAVFDPWPYLGHPTYVTEYVIPNDG